MHVGSGDLRFEVGEAWTLRGNGVPPEAPGVAVNSKGEVHVLTRSPHPVQVYDRNGRFLRAWGEDVFRVTHGIHIGPDDCVYIVDSGDSTVRKFSPTGELLFQLGEVDRRTPTGFRDGDYRTIETAGPPFNSPTNVAVGPNNDLFVTDGYGNARVHRFSEAGELQASWGEPGNGPGQFNIPHGVFIDRRGIVYIADRENDRIQRFTTDGEFIGQWTDVRRPDTLFITDDDQAYVAELGYIGGMVPGMAAPSPGSLASRITVRDLDGTIRAQLGPDVAGDLCAPGNFFGAHGISVDAEGSVYVGEVIAAIGQRQEGDFGWIPRSCHALQVFRRV